MVRGVCGRGDRSLRGVRGDYGQFRAVAQRCFGRPRYRAAWRASYEATQIYDYHGWAVSKTGSWGQGPVLLQSLSIPSQVDAAGVDPNSADFVHMATEAMKLAFADREAFYGDPAVSTVPIETLLSADHARGAHGVDR